MVGDFCEEVRDSKKADIIGSIMIRGLVVVGEDFIELLLGSPSINVVPGSYFTVDEPSPRPNYPFTSRIMHSVHISIFRFSAFP